MNDDDVYRLRKQIKALYLRIQRELPAIEGLPTTTLQLLVAVERSETAISPSRLCDELQMKDSNVAAALRQLEARNLVARRNDPLDGRRAMIEITAAGEKVVVDLIHERYAWLRETINTALSKKEQDALLMAGELMQRLASFNENEGA